MIFILLSVVGLSSLTFVIAEPCGDYVTLSNEKRSALYDTKHTEPNICDQDIDESVWYRFKVLPPHRLHDECVQEFRCGTDRPIWMNGAHPAADDPEVKQVEVCSPTDDDCCGGWKSSILVKFCPAADPEDDDGFYVYRLKRVPQCDMGYCAGNVKVCSPESVWNPVREKCTGLYPNITTPLFEGPIIAKKTLKYKGRQEEYEDFYFVCAVRWSDPDGEIEKRGEQFEVVFTFDGNEVDAVPPRIVDGSDLRVKLWSKELIGQVGKTVGCKMRAHWMKLKKIGSQYLLADRTYFVGIRYSIENTEGSFTSPRIEIDEKSPPLTLYFKASVPISCPEIKESTTCKVTINTADIKANDGVGLSGCSIVFSALETSNEPKTLKVKALPTSGIYERTSVVQFRKISTNTEFFWNNYQLPDILISIKDSSKTGICTSAGDPHITTFDQRYYHAYMEGDYLLAKSTSPRHFEVHVRHHKCGSVTCNCAVVVREGNNVLGVNACQAPNYSPIPITYLQDNVPGATMTNNGNVYTITMPSGAYVRMEWFGVHSNIQLYLNSEDHGKISGLCGTFDDNPGDDTVPKGEKQPETGDIPVKFTESYRLSTEESLINGHVHPIQCLEVDTQVPNICSCQGKKAVACDTPDIKTKTFASKFAQHCKEKQVEPNRRLRREVGSNETSTEGDNDGDEQEEPEVSEPEPMEEFMLITEEDLPLPEFDENHGRNVTLRWPTPNGITEAEAHRQCRSRMEASPVFQVCRDQISHRLDSIVTSCVTDVQIIADVEQAVSYILSDFHTNCVQQLESSVVKNDTESVVRNETDVRPSPAEDVVSQVVAKICPAQCNRNGNCSNGKCICNDGFAGQDCSVNAREPPTLKSFRKHSACDSRSTFCSETSIFASNIFLSEKLSCKIFAVDQSQQFSFVGSLVSTGEVICRLPEVHRFTSQAPAMAEGPSAEVGPAPFYRWDIALTNDGSLYSNSLRLTVYDSKCQECRPDGTCTQKEETCVIGGRCFLSEESSVANPCEKCIPSESRNRWSYDKSKECVKVSSATGISFSFEVLIEFIAFVIGYLSG